LKLKRVKRMYSLQGAYPRKDKMKIKEKENWVLPGTSRRGGK